LNFEKEPYNPWLAYAQSKTANIYFAAELERRYKSKGVHALAVHPGSVLTNLTQHVDMSQFDLSGALGRHLKSLSQGAATTVYAALSKDWEGRGGRYLSNCAEEPPLEPGVKPESVHPGYAPWMNNEELESKLWDESNRLVGLKE
jgi:hypothetical protein